RPVTEVVEFPSLSRDTSSARRRSASPPKRDGGNTLIGIFIGLLLGLALAAAVAYFITKSPSPFQSPAKSDARNDLTGRAPGPASEKPRFDFYKILPGTDDAKPAAIESRPANPPGATVAVSAPATQGGEAKSGDRYFL